MQRLGKTIKIDSDEILNIRVGTVNSNSPKSVFINLSGWCYSTDKLSNPEKIIDNTNKRIRMTLNNSDNLCFCPSKTIVEFNVSTKGLNKDKAVFMLCEITLFQKKLKPFDTPELLTETKTISYDICNTIKTNMRGFTIKPQKN